MKLPDVGEGVVEAELIEWKVRVGETVQEDQHVADVMTDKATVELTAPVGGVVLELGGEPGDRLRVGSMLIVFETDAAAADAGADRAQGALPRETPPAPVRAGLARDTRPSPVGAGDAGDTQPSAVGAGHARDTQPRGTFERRPLAAPTVRRRAREAQVELAEVPGTGRGGRITHEDLSRYIGGSAPTNAGLSAPSGTSAPAPAAPPTAQEAPAVSRPAGAAPAQGTEQIRLIGLRRVIAENLARSKRSIPHFTYVEEVDVTELERLRQHLNAQHAGQRPRLTYLPFLMLALVRALREYPQCNAHYDEASTTITRFAAVHCGIATQTPGGLMVPVVRHCEVLDLWGCAAQMQRVTAAARDGKAAREELSGSTITITSLGALGGIVSTPVINHPEVAIIGVNRSVERPVVLDGQIMVRRMMNLSSSFDHRIVDGHDAAVFVQRLRGMLEYPPTLFV
jgi:2-oxoisovalerate dehydrogenase E2 component (dihydrolipoyl transacylase)